MQHMIAYLYTFAPCKAVSIKISSYYQL